MYQGPLEVFDYVKFIVDGVSDPFLYFGQVWPQGIGGVVTVCFDHNVVCVREFDVGDDPTLRVNSGLGEAGVDAVGKEGAVHLLLLVFVGPDDYQTAIASGGGGRGWGLGPLLGGAGVGAVGAFLGLAGTSFLRALLALLLVTMAQAGAVGVGAG